MARCFIDLGRRASTISNIPPICGSSASRTILAHAVAQRFETSSSGALVPATEGSTKSVTVTTTNAGIATVEQFDLRLARKE
jgi:hypothetical protein